MIEAIAVVILLVSVTGIVMIIFRKIPILVEIPEINEGLLRQGIWSKLKSRIFNFHPSRFFSFETFLQKILSKIRILTLRIESKTSNWLQKLREKSQKKNLGSENYWQELKNSAKKEKK